MVATTIEENCCVPYIESERNEGEVEGNVGREVSLYLMITTMALIEEEERKECLWVFDAGGKWQDVQVRKNFW